MKRLLLLNLIIQLFLFGSCKKDDPKPDDQVMVLDTVILAGQKSGVGIKYVDLEPDIDVTLVNPWNSTDSIFYLDLNDDGIDDFTIKCDMCSPVMLGGDCEYVHIAPLPGNGVCINPGTDWLDTIPKNAVINTESTWFNEEVLIYSYYMVIGGDPPSTEGYWKDAAESGKYYIGVKLFNEDMTHYGWIGMHRDTTAFYFRFLVTDYAILEEYAE